MANGQMVVLDADRDYTDPFLLPVDAYVCDTLKGLPAPMQQFVQVSTRYCVTINHPFSDSAPWALFVVYSRSRARVVRGEFILSRTNITTPAK
jgi:hypothetical protein